MKTSKKKLLSTIVKISISVFLLYLVFTKISFGEIWNTIKSVKTHFIVLALLFFILSQWVSAKRLLLFFKEKGFDLSNKSNNILYLIGMFYNFFIPGGIGGDAYKVYVLNKNFKWSLKTLTAAVFVDRFMGLTAIGILISILSFNLIPSSYLYWLVPIAIIMIIGISYFFVKHFFNDFLNIFNKALLFSLLIQLLQVGSVIFIILSLENSTLNFINYIVIFLISSVLSIFSFSGIGIREYVFYEASILLNIDSSIAVSIGVLFSIITAMVSLLGIIYHFKKPKLYLSENNQMR
ncbi:MAG: lysylphosphatidylglycerol synthase transmembrane domain-containing protein [Bacteroidota bacterium]